VLVRLRYQPFVQYLTEAGIDMADLPAWLATIDLDAHERGEITAATCWTGSPLRRCAARPRDLERRWLDMFDRSAEMFELAQD